jgi:hypothetical protein
VESVNPMLQARLNPKQRGDEEIIYGDSTFREHDRVMQIKNNYEIEWRSITELGVGGKGIFNGEMGRISAIDRSERTVTVLFDEEREAEYPFEQLNELELCYAITVHKSQGSEFDYCVIPLSGIPGRLCTRNILYTAVTRARRMVVLTGATSAIWWTTTPKSSATPAWRSGSDPAPGQVSEADNEHIRSPQETAFPAQVPVLRPYPAPGPGRWRRVYLFRLRADRVHVRQGGRAAPRSAGKSAETVRAA